MDNIKITDFIFAKGVDTKSNPVFVTSNVLKLENAEVINQKIKKSKGYTELGDSDIDTDTTNQYVFTYNDNLYKIQNDKINLYRKSVDSFLEIGDNRTVTTRNFLASSNINDINYTPIISCISGDYFCYMLFNASSDYYELHIFNIENNVLEYSDTSFLLNDGTDTGIVWDLVGVEGGLVVYFTENAAVSSTNVREKVITFYNFSTIENVNIITDLYYFDSTVAPDYVKPYYRSLVAKYVNGLIFVFYRVGIETACTGKLIVRNLSTGTVFTIASLGSSVDLTSDQGFRNLGVFALNNDDFTNVLFMFGLNFYLVNSNSFVSSLFFSYTTAPGYTAGDEIFQTFNVGILPNSNELVLLKHNPQQTQTSGTQVCPFVNKYNYSTNTWTLYTNTCDSRYTSGEYYSVRGSCSLAGGVVCLNNQIYFPIAVFSYIYVESGGSVVVSTPDTVRRCTVFLVDDQYNVAEVLYSYDVSLNTSYNGSDASVSYFQTTPFVKVDAETNANIKIIYPFFINQTLTELNNAFNYTYSVRIFEVTSEIPTNFFNTDYNKSSYYGNSRLVELSGNSISEQNFFDYPQIEVVESATTGNLSVGGSYIYSAIYEWANGKGEIVQSSTSIEKNLTLTASNTSASIYYTPAPFFTSKPGYKVKFFRTTDLGSVFFETLEYLASNLPVSSSFIVTDTNSDTTIEENVQLYTNGGILANFPFPPSKAFVESNKRIWCIAKNDPTVVVYSFPETANISLSTNPNFYVQMPAEGGDCIALANLDEKTIVFKRDYIFAITGNPPNAANLNSTLRAPYQINSPVGGISPNSVVRTPLGIMFKSVKGIYLLDRSLAVSYIGANVESYNEYTVTSAVLLFSENKVKFTLLDGPVLSFDYYYQEWSVENSLFFTSSCIYDEAFVGLRLNGETYQASDVYTRNGKNYSIFVQSPWLSGSTIQSYQEIKEIQFLGKFLAPHQLKISLYYDYNDYPEQIIYFDPNEVLGVKNSYGLYDWGAVSVYGGNVDSVYLFRITPLRTSCMSVSLGFSDVFENSILETGNSLELYHLRLVSRLVDPVYPVNNNQII